MAIPAGVITGIALASALIPVVNQLIELTGNLTNLIKNANAPDPTIQAHIEALKPQIDAMIDQVKAFNTRIATSLPEAPPPA